MIHPRLTHVYATASPINTLPAQQKTCQRCGRVRETRHNRRHITGPLCQDCKIIEQDIARLERQGWTEELETAE